MRESQKNTQNPAIEHQDIRQVAQSESLNAFELVEKNKP